MKNIVIVFLLISQLACVKYSKQSGQGTEVISLNPPQRDYFPTSEWQRKDASVLGIRPEILTEIEDYAFQDDDDLGTKALLIVKDGYLAYEKYHTTYSPQTKHKLWSISKSFVNLLYGIAVRDKIIDIDEPVAKYIPDFNNPEKRNILIRQLLTMSAGLAWKESYETAPLKSSIVAMLYTTGRKNMGEFVAQRPVSHEVDKKVNYSSGDTMLLMAILQAALGEDYANYPWQEIFEPLRIENVVWEKDFANNYIGSSSIYISARDLAKFAYLYLNNGIWDDKRILQENWINFTRTPSIAYYSGIQQESLETLGVLGAHWWVNTKIPSQNQEEVFIPSLATDTFYSQGKWGQWLFVIPSWDMILIRYGTDRNNDFDPKKLFSILKKGVVAY